MDSVDGKVAVFLFADRQFFLGLYSKSEIKDVQYFLTNGFFISCFRLLIKKVLKNYYRYRVILNANVAVL